MRKVIVVCALVLSAAVSSQQTAFAIKPFGDVFKAKYADVSENEDFKKLVKEANCNVCHVKNENKKVRNPYGEAGHKAGLDKKHFEKLLKEDADKGKKEIEALLIKIEEEKAEGAAKTFGEKIKAGELPGGDKDGKQGAAVKLTSFSAATVENEFVTIFDGKTFDGWKVNENKSSWKIEDGAFVCQGERSHLFYVGDEKPFKNFHLKIEVKTNPNSNGGIYFHTKYQDEGWPKYGFECQVNNSYERDPKRTASLYEVVNVMDAAAKDNEWYTQEIIVQGKKITLKIDGKTLYEYNEPEGAKAGKDFTRVIDEGTFALQCHDPGSRVLFRNIQVKRLD